MTDLVVISTSPLTLQVTNDPAPLLTVTLPPATLNITPAPAPVVTIASDPAPSLTVQAADATLVIQQPQPVVVEVVAQGPQGPRGGVLIRTQSIVSSATIVPDSDQFDLIDITALGVPTSIAAPLGTPTNGQRLMFRFTDSGSSQSLTWASAYISGGISLPGATTAGKIQHLGFFYDSNLSKWMSVAGIIQP